MELSKNLAIYIHYPFCKSKCPYCDFNSHISNNLDEDEFILGYENELKFFAENIAKSKVASIFFGGGTPSLMSEKMLSKILNKINQLFKVNKNCEITLEANPTSFETSKFINFKKIGINRLSLGIQALNDKDLKFLGRNHSANEALKSIESVAKIYDNFSFDLIYARPNQNIKDWLKELEFALEFNSPHLSLYQLTIEKGTPFYKSFNDGEFSLPNDKTSSVLYNETNSLMKINEYENYEISNYAKKNFECRHNLSYWQGDDYIGVGAGAHSRAYLINSDYRQAISMICQPESWLKKTQKYGNGIQKQYNLSKYEIAEELILTCLRTNSGLTNKILEKHHLEEIEEIINIDKLNNLIDLKAINISKNQLMINKNYKLFTNHIIGKICDSLKIK